MSRLVVISNRVPPPGGTGAEAGGLAVALKVVLRQRGGLWLGWSGQTAEEDEPDRVKVHFREEGNILFALVDLTRRDLDEYYNGFANRALWPLLHYRLDLADFDRQDLSGYLRVNAFFAKVLAERLEPDDTIWVQDYHLIPLAAELRARGAKNRIGFFLHIPWPPPDVWYAMPAHYRLLEAFTAYDLIGFQTEWDAENFALCLKREGLATGDRARPLPGRLARILHRRLSDRHRDQGIRRGRAQLARSNPLVKRMVTSLRDRYLVIGVDRLDYSKGIDQRMLAYERFLQNNPAYHNKVTYLQITPKSRSDVPEYAEMQAEVAGTAGRINGAFGHLDWTPIRYINRTIKRATLAGLYRMSDVGLVTPLRDGMNLVAKEFVAAQDGDDPGVLVLSRFAGAAPELSGALIVNPYDLDSTGNAIARAISMPREDRVARWRDMFERLLKNDVSSWADNFLDALEERPEDASLKAAS